MKDNTLDMLDRLIREVPMGLGHLQNLIEVRNNVAELVGVVDTYRMAHKLRLSNHAKAESGKSVDAALLKINRRY